MEDLTSKIIDYEMGDLGMEDTIALFQELIDTGMVWSLQGTYGRTAVALIDAGLCSKKGENNDSKEENKETSEKERN